MRKRLENRLSFWIISVLCEILQSMYDWGNRDLIDWFHFHVHEPMIKKYYEKNPE